MKTLIGWYGTRGDAEASALRFWLRHVVPMVDLVGPRPDAVVNYDSLTDNVPEFQGVDFCVLCMTAGDNRAAWMRHATEISLGLYRWVGLLIDMDVDQAPAVSDWVYQPMSLEGILQLVGLIHAACMRSGPQLDDSIASRVAVEMWPHLEQELSEIAEGYDDPLDFALRRHEVSSTRSRERRSAPEFSGVVRAWLDHEGVSADVKLTPQGRLVQVNMMQPMSYRLERRLHRLIEGEFGLRWVPQVSRNAMLLESRAPDIGR